MQFNQWSRSKIFDHEEITKYQQLLELFWDSGCENSEKCEYREIYFCKLRFVAINIQ